MTSTADRSSAAGQAPGTPPGRPAVWAALRPLVLRLHFYAGILVAPFLLVAAGTGLLYAASFQIEQVVYRHELTAPAGPATLPLSRQIEAARAAQPQGTITAVRPAAEPGHTTRVLMDRPGLPESTRLAVFVDPHTGRVRGQLESYGDVGALPVRAWISNLHRDLHLGEPGGIYSELAAGWLWVVALGGLALWVTRRRREKRRLLLPGRAVRGGRRTLSWHGSVGLWAVPGLLFLSVTGLSVTLGWTAAPSISPQGGGHAAHTGAGGHRAATADVGVDRIARAAADKGLSGPLEIVWPGDPGAPYLVREIDKTAPTRLDQVAVDAATGQVTGELRFADYPLAAKLLRWGVDGHMGLLFGPANQILLAALAIALIILIVLGYRMWWLRRPTRGFGEPYPRGGWRQVHWTVLTPLGLLTAAAGIFVPLMGVSLVLFLVIDALLGLRSRRAARRQDRALQPDAQAGRTW
ncbi:PepSY domain-containing protein [Planomonospora sp. ID91781]|uniref:PepSY-associated TM helix domain-containing protein n=1 Tax=Planomonospora sp. ID91781 TaxID=2738135 RepID=UPI0018C3B15D|nr:PepSY-associated TM helix domain-containing protein [Planomonospora sp. ID91781]MBG0823130.1 PepSY domain-containing protein [Planomonospora sp. ID91781]